MAANYEDRSTRIWKEKRTSEDDPAVRPGDWRDPDAYLSLDHFTIYSNDLDYQESHSKSEPDWNLGCEIRDDRNHVIATFAGEPPSVFKRCLLEGRVLQGVIVARDEQRHN